jgi:phosphate:Na+ symporter
MGLRRKVQLIRFPIQVSLSRFTLAAIAVAAGTLLSAAAAYADVETTSDYGHIAPEFEFGGLRVFAEGSGQEGRSGHWLGKPFKIEVFDPEGNCVPGVSVEFWIENGGKAELSVAETVTDEMGIAETRLRLGTDMKEYVISAFLEHAALGSGVVRFKARSYDPMKITLWLIGGLGLFLYGISLMSSSLQKTAGQRLKNLLKLLTSNRFVAVGMGALVTALIQSSSATSVMVIGFVNAGLLHLQQAIGVVIGANIGTTITGQLIAFKIDKFALPIIGIGFAVIMLSKRKQTRLWGEAILGFGLLFLGLSIMKQVLTPLGGSEVFRSFFVRFSTQPILGVLAGMVATLIIQSSSATVGLTMALAAAGLIDIRGAICLVLGENIGTTITAQLASIGSNRIAKRAAFAHTMFNVLGVVGMTVIMYTTSFYVRLVEMTSADVMRQVANSHTLFNVMNAAVFLPLVGVLRRVVERIVPAGEADLPIEPQFLERHLLETPLVALQQAKSEIVRMATISRMTVLEATRTFFAGDNAGFKRIHMLEDGIDNLQREITHYLVELAKRSLTEVESEQLPVLLHTVNDIEKIGDHAENIVELAERRKFQRVRLPDDAAEELRMIAGEVDRMAGYTIEALSGDDISKARRALEVEERVNRLHMEMRQGYARRLRKGQAGVSSGLLFFDMVMNYEKMGDHYTNIAQAVLGQLQWDKGIKAVQPDEDGIESHAAGGGDADDAVRAVPTGMDGEDGGDPTGDRRDGSCASGSKRRKGG